MLYQFTGDAFDTDTATALTSGKIYKSTSNQTLYFGANKLKEGAKLLLVLTADGVEGRSDEDDHTAFSGLGNPVCSI